MFIGHFAVGLAGKRIAPRASLATLILAALWLDTIWPFFLALGLEHVRIDPGNTVVTPLDLYDYPYSHSLLFSLGWSLLFALMYLALRRHARTAAIVGALVFSHFVLDYVVHRPDLPLYPGSPVYLGLGLWNSRLGTLLVEVPMFIGGAWLYTTSTEARRARGTALLAAYVGLLLVLYFSAQFGPPPPSVDMLIKVGFVSWLFVPWAWWIDRERRTRLEPSTED